MTCTGLSPGIMKERAIRLGMDEAMGIIDTMLSSKSNALESLKYKGLYVLTSGYCMLPIMVKTKSISNFLWFVTVFKVPK